MKRYIAIITMVVAMLALSALPAFAHPGNSQGGGNNNSVKCQLTSGAIVSVANANVCLNALNGTVIDVG